jgi:hypothetical protein
LEPAYFLASAELRLHPFAFSAVGARGLTGFLKPMGLVPFFDYGKVWNLLGDEPSYFSSAFYTTGEGRGLAFGAGIRYPLLGIFNLRLDFAWGRPDGGAIPFAGRAGDAWPDQWVIDLAQAF